MARFTLLFLSFFIAGLVSNSQARVATLEDENVVDVGIDTVEKTESDLDKKIQDLKQKVKDLVEQGKENERAFNAMTEKVRSMDSKVKDMTERLRKINNADYLNAGAEEIKNL